MPVLIVESNAQLGLLWKRHLGRLGKTVVLVETDTEALNVLRTQHVSIIVLDVMLPNRSGFDILKDLRGDPELKHLPILMLTAKGQIKDRERAEHLGSSHFMTKPFSNAEVRDVLHKLVKDA